MRTAVLAVAMLVSGLYLEVSLADRVACA